MRFATFNVNSIRARLAPIIAWLDEQKPDVVALQETKVIDADFPSEDFVRRGYGVAMAGQKTYNGVALLSHLPLRDIKIGLDGDAPDADRRYISATVGGVRCASVYVPNGKDVTNPAFAGKLEWLERLGRTLRAETESSGLPMLVGGDFNIALGDLDVWSVEAMTGQIHFTRTSAQHSGASSVTNSSMRSGQPMPIHSSLVGGTTVGRRIDSIAAFESTMFFCLRH